MATPRFVAPPVSEDYASQILAVHEEGFRRRMLAADMAQDEQYRRDTAEYTARVSFATAQLEAAQKEVAAAKKAVLDVEIKDAQGAAAAVRAQAAASRDAMLMAAIAGKGGGSSEPRHIQVDGAEDAVQKYVSGFEDWGKVTKGLPPEAEKALRVAEARARETGLPNTGVVKLLALSQLEADHLALPPGQKGPLDRVSLVTLRDAAVKEALDGNANWQGVLAMFSDGIENLELDTASTVINGVMKVQDVGTKGGNTPADAAAEEARKAAAAAQAKAEKAEAKAAASADTAAGARPDFTAARELAAQRLAEAEEGLGAVRLPERAPVADRITRTREAYADAYRPGQAGRTAPTADPIDEMLDQLEARRSRALGPKATTPEARTAEAAADEVIRAPVPARTAPRAPTYEMDRTEKADAKAGRLPAATPAAPPPHPAIPLLQEKGAYDVYVPEEQDMSNVDATPLARHRPLLEGQGLIGREGVRRSRATRLAATTDEGRRARAALDDAGGDLDRALAKLQDDRARAIAVALVA